jgi:GNAT superfamily N-acetyltransferase
MSTSRSRWPQHEGSHSSSGIANAQLIERGVASLIEAFRRVARLSEHGAIEEHDHVISIATGVPVPSFNPTFVMRPPRDPDRAFRRVRDFYMRLAFAGEVTAWGDTAPAIGDAATRAALVAGHRIPCLLQAPLGVTVPTAPDLEIRRVDDAAALLRFNDVCAEAFGLERQAIAIFDDPRLLAMSGSTPHVGLVGGVPVATAWSYCIDGVVLLFNVATVASHRRRGIGEAMTWRAIQDGLERGCDVAFLQASRAGRPLYERMGFRPAVDMQTWSLAPSP